MTASKTSYHRFFITFIPFSLLSNQFNHITNSAHFFYCNFHLILIWWRHSNQKIHKSMIRNLLRSLLTHTHTHNDINNIHLAHHLNVWAKVRNVFLQNGYEDAPFHWRQNFTFLSFYHFVFSAIALPTIIYKHLKRIF